MMKWHKLFIKSSNKSNIPIEAEQKINDNTEYINYESQNKEKIIAEQIESTTETVVKQRGLRTVSKIEVSVSLEDLRIDIYANDRSVAYMYATTYDGKNAYLKRLHVDGKIRRCGLATAMMQGFIELIEDKYESLYLHVSPGELCPSHIEEGINFEILEKDELIKFYNKFGLVEGDQIEGYPCFLILKLGSR